MGQYSIANTNTNQSRSGRASSFPARVFLFHAQQLSYTHNSYVLPYRLKPPKKIPTNTSVNLQTTCFCCSWSSAGNTLRPKTVTGIASTSVVTSVIGIWVGYYTLHVTGIHTAWSATIACTLRNAQNAVTSLAQTLRGSNTRESSGTRETSASSAQCARHHWLEGSFFVIQRRTRFSVPPIAPEDTRLGY